MHIIPVLTVSSTEAIKQAVIAGLGVAMITRLAIQAETKAGLLVELNVKGLRIEYPIYHIWRKGRSQSKLAAKFLDLVNIVKPVLRYCEGPDREAHDPVHRSTSEPA